MNAKLVCSNGWVKAGVQLKSLNSYVKCLRTVRTKNFVKHTKMLRRVRSEHPPRLPPRLISRLLPVERRARRQGLCPVQARCPSLDGVLSMNPRDDWMDLARSLKASGKTGTVDPRGQARCLTISDCVKLARFWNRQEVRNRRDPTPWCSGCGARKQADCHCGPIARNE